MRISLAWGGLNFEGEATEPKKLVAEEIRTRAVRKKSAGRVDPSLSDLLKPSAVAAAAATFAAAWQGVAAVGVVAVEQKGGGVRKESSFRTIETPKTYGSYLELLLHSLLVW